MDKDYIDKLAFILIKDKKILGVWEVGKTAWMIPGGKREEGESDEQALTREVKEELSVDLIPGTIKSYGVFKGQAHGKPEGTIVNMSCYTAEYEGELKPIRPILRLEWMDSSKKDQASVTGKMILENLSEKSLID